MDSGISTNGGGRGRSPEVGLEELRKAEYGDVANPVSEDDILEVLSNRRRRQVITYLQEGNGTATAGELAEHIAAAENDTSVAQVSSDQRKRVYVSLYQHHLPMLDDANVVDYDRNRKTVDLLVDGGSLEPVVIEHLDAANHRAMFGGAVVLAVVVLLGSLQVGVFAAAPAWTWITIGSVGLLGLVGLVRRSH